jgi:hypothetical protein
MTVVDVAPFFTQTVSARWRKKLLLGAYCFILYASSAYKNLKQGYHSGAIAFTNHDTVLNIQ